MKEWIISEINGTDFITEYHGSARKGNQSSLIKLAIQDTCDAANGIAQYSASLLNRATTFCFCEDQLIRLGP